MSISQDLLPPHLAKREIALTKVPLSKAAADITSLSSHACIGVATQVSSDGLLNRLALATNRSVLLISLESKNQSKPRELSAFLEDGPVLLGVGMAQIALQIHRDFKAHIGNGVDLSTLCSPSKREAWAPSKLVSYRLCAGADFSRIDRLWYGVEDESSTRQVALRAWISVMLAEACAAEIQESRKINTKYLSNKELLILGDLVCQADALTAHKPKEMPNDFVRGIITSEGMKLENARFQNRVRRSNQTSVIMTNERGEEFIGRADGVEGRTTDIKFGGAGFRGQLTKVCVVGKEELTNAERARVEFILLALRGELNVKDSLFIGFLWLPHPTHAAELAAPPEYETGDYLDSSLNRSQIQALGRMTSAMPIVTVQGPPGTGKTKTIAAAAAVWEAGRLPVWIVAQSNVAVKNIAEKLAKGGIKFKIVVSKEFYVEWHEHIYGSIEDFLIRSDELSRDEWGLGHILNGARVILSTLSTLSNPVLDQVGMFSLVPVERLVVDEASQINAFDFMHVFHKFRKTLKKMCFFGDPMQLPPYGTEQARTLKSIFDLKHLQNLTAFLDTQYRMPVPIGAFISKYVYDGRLVSKHEIKNMDCVVFIDVSKGHEVSSGLSWKNPGEIQAICHLVQRYAHKNFCIITPYDAQRAAIENQLKAEKLPHDAVFNVDSFQGNEADYVLVSVVRTTQPGFLKSLNRMNVMLTRARKGMVIVTCAAFLRSESGARTLLGKLSQYWEQRGEDPWIDWRRVADGTAHLPGSARSAPLHDISTQDTWRRPADRDTGFPPLPGVKNNVDAQEIWRRPVDLEADFPPLSGTPRSVQNAGSARPDLFSSRGNFSSSQAFDFKSNSFQVTRSSTTTPRDTSAVSWRALKTNTAPQAFPPLPYRK